MSLPTPRRATRYLLRWFHVAGFCLAYGSGAAFLQVRVNRLGRWLLRLSGRELLRLFGVTVRMDADLAPGAGEKLVIIANHDIALIDALVMFGFFGAPTVTTRKTANELGLFLPILEKTLRRCGLEFMELNKAGKSKGMFYLKRQLAREGRVFLFPSGTQKKRIVQRLQGGLLLLARTPGAVILPLFITYSSPGIIGEAAALSWKGFLLSQFHNLDRDIRVNVSAGTKVSPGDFPTDEALGRHIQDLYQNRLYGSEVDGITQSSAA